MLGRATLLQLILWITTAHAFFPWFPAWVCADDDVLCKNQTQAASTAGVTQEERSLPVQAVAEGITFKIGRRVLAHQAENNEPLKDKVERIAHRLAKKYAPVGGEHALTGRRHPHPAASPTAPEAKLAKRTNTFSIVTAATPTATNAVGIDQDGTDFSYFIQASFGSAGTPLLMLLDTGAGTTWVMGSNCQSTACTMHNTFGAANSKTLETSGDTFSIAYGSGTVAGNLASDTVNVASISMTMSFGIANTTSDDFTHFPFDGILGLSLSQAVTDNFLQTVKTDKVLASNIFGVSLWRDTDGGANTGEIIFGATDPSKYSGSISYTSVSSSGGGDWAIPMDDVGYNGGKAGVTGRLAYIDTGTTYVFGPAADVAALHKQIPGASSSDGGVTYTVPCTSSKPLTVYFSGVAYSISPEDWLSAPATDGNCTSNIYGHAVVSNAWLMGDLFIKNVYAVFDADQTRIGFASKPAAAQSSTSTTSAVSSSKTGNSGSSSGSSVSGVSVASAVSATTTPSSSGTGGSSSGGALPGLSGHETSATAVAESTAAPTTTAATSPADQVKGNGYVFVVCIAAAIAMVV